jgi:hypothetical protein
MLGFGHGWRWTRARQDRHCEYQPGWLQRWGFKGRLDAAESARTIVDGPGKAMLQRSQNTEAVPAAGRLGAARSTRACGRGRTRAGLGRADSGAHKGRSRGQLTASEVGLVISLAGCRQQVDSEAAGRNSENTRPRTGPGHIMALTHLPETEKESYQVRGTASAEEHLGVNLNQSSMTRETDAISRRKCNHGWA